MANQQASTQAPPEPLLMRVSEAARELGLPYQTMLDMCHAQLAHACVRVGAHRRSIRVVRRKLMAWLAEEQGNIDVPIAGHIVTGRKAV